MDALEIVASLGAELLYVDEVVWVLSRPIGVPASDFELARYLPCRRPWRLDAPVTAISRMGALDDYAALHARLAAVGIHLVNDVAAHERAASLPAWYPRIESLTPRSRWYDTPPTAADVEGEFDWPVFVKGERQTARHEARSVVRDAAAFDALMASWTGDRILGWQRVVVRELAPLRRVEADTGGKVPAAFEFRTFWWHGELVGAGPYWAAFADYDWTARERCEALAVARRAARAVDVPFLVVDVAQCDDGRWIVIECNDAQESGYTGVSRFGLWSALVASTRAMEAPRG